MDEEQQPLDALLAAAQTLRPGPRRTLTALRGPHQAPPLLLDLLVVGAGLRRAVMVEYLGADTVITAVKALTATVSVTTTATRTAAGASVSQSNSVLRALLADLRLLSLAGSHVLFVVNSRLLPAHLAAHARAATLYAVDAALKQPMLLTAGSAGAVAVQDDLVRMSEDIVQALGGLSVSYLDSFNCFYSLIISLFTDSRYAYY